MGELRSDTLGLPVHCGRVFFLHTITNARILDMDQTHVAFRWKDRTANGWRTERLPGVEFLQALPAARLLPRGFHKVRYYGLWHPSKRAQSNRACSSDGKVI